MRTGREATRWRLTVDYNGHDEVQGLKMRCIWLGSGFNASDQVMKADELEGSFPQPHEIGRLSPNNISSAVTGGQRKRRWAALGHFCRFVESSQGPNVVRTSSPKSSCKVPTPNAPESASDELSCSGPQGPTPPRC